MADAIDTMQKHKREQANGKKALTWDDVLNPAAASPAPSPARTPPASSPTTTPKERGPRVVDHLTWTQQPYLVPAYAIARLHGATSKEAYEWVKPQVPDMNEWARQNGRASGVNAKLLEARFDAWWRLREFRQYEGDMYAEAVMQLYSNPPSWFVVYLPKRVKPSDAPVEAPPTTH